MGRLHVWARPFVLRFSTSDGRSLFYVIIRRYIQHTARVVDTHKHDSYLYYTVYIYNTHYIYIGTMVHGLVPRLVALRLPPLVPAPALVVGLV